MRKDLVDWLHVPQRKHVTAVTLPCRARGELLSGGRELAMNKLRRKGGFGSQEREGFVYRYCWNGNENKFHDLVFES